MGYFGLMFVNVLCLLLFASSALAQVESSEYLSRLGTIQKFLESNKAGNSGGDAFARAVLPLQKRAFKPDEAWTVEFTPVDNPSMRKTGSPEELSAVARKPIFFDYKVVSVNAKGEAQVEVRQRVDANTPRVDSRLDYISLSMSAQYVILKKTVYYRDGKAPSVFATNGMSNVAIGFSAYPVDLPDLNSLEGEPIQGNALEFNFQDLYGRPIRAVWGNGDVWPRLVHTNMGTAVIISQTANGGRS